MLYAKHAINVASASPRRFRDGRFDTALSATTVSARRQPMMIKDPLRVSSLPHVLRGQKQSKDRVNAVSTSLLLQIIKSFLQKRQTRNEIAFSFVVERLFLYLLPARISVLLTPRALCFGIEDSS